MSGHKQNIIPLFWFKKIIVTGFGYHTNAHRYYKPIYKLFIPCLLELEEIRNAGTRRKLEEGNRTIYFFPYFNDKQRFCCV